MRTFHRVLITGAAGFAGSFLAEELVAAGYEVVGTRVRGEPTENLAAIRGRIDLRILDLRSRRECERLLRSVRPQAIFHLAAYSAVGASFADPALPMAVNFGGTLNLWEVIRRDRRLGRILQIFLVVGSSDMYGRVVLTDLPLTEDHPLNPVSPYAISKAAVDFLAATYHGAYGLPIVRVRAFNHAGPRQRTGFVIPDFAEQIVRLERKSGKRVLKTGNLSARRDVTDVRDVVHAYRLIAERGAPGEVYHVGSGRAVAIRSVLNTMLAMARRPITVVRDPRRARPVDVPILKADITKVSRWGWQPRIPFEQTLADTLDYYRSRR